ncbi:sensor histidine kinase [uncultured Jannaschia sp.]|uniref:sensor histidine kinase n=1 Tax=uncultured Jannaschia sp. TaxID=293347 RepID=UPI0026194C80|nr:sensor histidine kinase [uncultured Jannaschia sp.]
MAPAEEGLRAPGGPDPRVLIYAPLGRDADVLSEIARDVESDPVAVTASDALAARMAEGCDAVVLTEEALHRRTGETLLRHLEAQPSWSALPVLALVADAGRLPPGLRLPGGAAERVELVILQRPTRARTLRSTLVTLIGSRRRQRMVRDQIADQGAQERHLQFLLSELDHRVKNLLAKILGILNLTRREARDLDEFATAFEGRTRALAEAHQMLNGHTAHPGTLRSLVENVMAPYRDAEGSNLVIEGPEFALRPRAGLALAMALHELATNASKYGALSTGTGAVAIRWRLDDDALEFEWTERGGPPVAEPARTSFGTRLLRSYTSRELGGETELLFRPEGLFWKVRAPVAAD